MTPGPGQNPKECLQTMHAHQRALLSLCDRLEAVADSLPDQVDIQECMALSRSLAPTVSSAHRFEEEQFYPCARLVTGGGEVFEEMFQRFRGEHREDESFADEVSEVLLSWGMGSPARGTEATGYMLRGFFGQMRRHVASEKEGLCAAVAEQLDGKSPPT